MTEKWKGLVDTVQSFKTAVKRELDSENSLFHEELNGDFPIEFHGLNANQDSPNPYSIEASDILFWHDPTAYLDEMERWSNKVEADKYEDVKEYLSESNQTAQFNRLVSAIKKQRVAPFIGAGLSKNYGFPLWGEALKAIFEKVKLNENIDDETKDKISGYIERWEYIEAADSLYDLAPVIVASYLMNNFDANSIRDNLKPESSGIASLLPKLTDSCVITTNFDGIIEQVFLNAQKPIQGYMYGVQQENQFATKLVQGDKCILKLHGNFDSQNSHIFSSSQYAAAYGDCEIDYTKQLPRTLRQIFISHSLLFLGCSLLQDKTMDVFQDIIASNSFDIPNHFSLMPNSSNKDGKESALLNLNIQPIWYEVADHDHSQLEQLLRFAIDCAKGKVSL